MFLLDVNMKEKVAEIRRFLTGGHEIRRLFVFSCLSKKFL